MRWMIAANNRMYDHSSAFEKWGYIDWRRKAHYIKGDTVYVYCTRPLKRVMYKTIVEIADMDCDQIVNDREFWNDIKEYEKALPGRYARLRLGDPS